MLARRAFIALSGSAIAAPALLRRAQAQAYPSRFVRLVCPFPPGGAVDAAARIIAGRLSEMWGQQMVVENRPGAGGNIAATAVLSADADGYTVYIASIGHAISQFTTPSLTYHPVNDFAPVTLMCVYPNIMAIPNSSPRPLGAGFHRAREGQSRQDDLCVLGRRHVAVSRGRAVQAHGRRRCHAHSLSRRGACAERSHSRPGRCDLRELPLDAAAGAAGTGARPRGDDRASASRRCRTCRRSPSSFRATTCRRGSRCSLRRKRHREIVAKLHADAVAALNTPAVKARYAQLGATVVGSTPAELAAFLQAEIDRWGPVIKAAGIKDG